MSFFSAITDLIIFTMKLESELARKLRDNFISHLPGRTDNEIKNYWRTRIQKHIKQAESFGAGQGSENNSDPASSSRIPGAPADHFAVETYSPISYPGNDQSCVSQVSGAADFHHHVMETNSPISSYAANLENFPAPFLAESNENVWSMEDLWHLHLLNGD
ncbi:hypothetical protein U1Q18_038348 [Sarracenia purpurea var. burkii]